MSEARDELVNPQTPARGLNLRQSLQNQKERKQVCHKQIIVARVENVALTHAVGSGENSANEPY